MDEDQITLSRIEQQLQDNLELAEENNRLLRQVRRSLRVSFWLRILIWAVVIILPILLLGPILNAIIPATGDAAGPLGLPSVEDLERLREAFDSANLSPQ
jgi:hypothetical protein